MQLPPPRGALSEVLVAALPGRPPRVPGLASAAAAAVAACPPDRVLCDEDLQLALYLLYELHYQGFDGVDDGWEWAPDLLAVRAGIEDVFERALRDRARVPVLLATSVPAVVQALFALTAEDSGPSLSAYLAREATLGQFREFLVQRSVYQLKEADPHTWALPRLAGRAKAALAEVQADEYGGGRAERMHAALFARTMRAGGLDDTHGAYVDRVPAVTLAGLNAMSLFGLHRRLRGAAVGHLAAFEMSSSVPNRRYGDGLRRLGFDRDATWFFDEHVEADAVHEQIAAYDLCGSLVAEEPALAPDVLLGAATAVALDRLFTEHLLGAWAEGHSSLRSPAGAALGSVA